MCSVTSGLRDRGLPRCATDVHRLSLLQRGRRSLGLSLEKPLAAQRAAVLLAIFFVLPSCPISAIREPLFELGMGGGEISVKKEESHFSVICEVVKKPLSWFLH